MAVGTLSAVRTRFVVMMRGIVEFGGQVASGADLIARRAQFQAVRLMAIRAGDACGKHSALTEGAVFVIFLSDLAVLEVDTRCKQAWNGTVEQRSPIDEMVSDFLTPAMAETAGIDLGI